MSQNKRWRLITLLGMVSLMYFFVNLQRSAIPGALFNQLQKEFDLSTSGVAALGSGFTYVYATAQLLVGLIIGKLGWVKTVRVGGLLFSAGALLFPLAANYPAAYICRLLTGAGAGCLYLSAVQMTMEIFPEKFSMVLGINLIIGFAGGVAANAPLIAVEEIFGWKNVLLTVGAALTALYLAWCLLSIGTTPSEKEASQKFGSLKNVLSKRSNWYIWIFNWVNFGLYYVIYTVIGKKYLEDFAHFTPGRAAMIVSTVGIIAAFSGVVQAYLSGLCGNRKAVFCRGATLISLAVFAGQLVMLTTTRVPMACAILFCLLATTATMSALTIPLLKESNENSDFGLAAGMMNFGNYMAVAVFGDLAGFLVGLYPAQVINGVKVYGNSSYIALFTVLIVFIAPAMTCAWLIKDRKS
ncbi:MAG: MFS transporter [Lentisphaeria bacterium]|nr:MFS transporter [Lentisphaeria bacterium]